MVEEMIVDQKEKSITKATVMKAYANSSVDWLMVFVCWERGLFGGYPVTMLSLQNFYPAALEITEIIETTDKIIIRLKSHIHSQKCPACGKTGTAMR